MIVNSQPYNPSQRSQQQRCIGVNQQNTLYGLKLATDAPVQSNQQARPNHIFDLTTLQQEQEQQQLHPSGSNLFDSPYDAATFSQHNHQSDHQTQASQTGNKMNINNNNNNNNTAANKQHHTAAPADVSLYSPTSSTSLLYHHYDQINVPNDHSSQQNNNHSNNDNVNANQANFKRSNTTLILNASNLFNQTGANQLALPQQVNQQFSTNTTKTTIPQQELYGAGAQYHLQQPSFNTLHHNHNHNHHQHHQLQIQQQQQQQQQQHHSKTYGLDNHQFMLDTILRQQHAATTSSRLGQHNSYHNRPLSSSGASSMSGQSMALTYGRQPRQANGQLPPLPPLNSSKSQSNQTLNHNHNHHHHQHGITMLGAIPSSWDRAQRRMQSFAFEYGIQLKIAMLIILVIIMAFISAIKITPTTSHTQQQQQQQQATMNSQNLATSNMNPLIYPPATKGEFFSSSLEDYLHFVSFD